jgi:hypothetical protein
MRKFLTISVLIILFLSCKDSKIKFKYQNICYPCYIIVNNLNECSSCIGRQAEFDFSKKDTPTYVIFNTADTEVIHYYMKDVIKQKLHVINDTFFCDSLLNLTHRQTCLFKFRSRNKIDTIINMKVYSGCPRKLD